MSKDIMFSTPEILQESTDRELQGLADRKKLIFSLRSEVTVHLGQFSEVTDIRVGMSDKIDMSGAINFSVTLFALKVPYKGRSVVIGFESKKLNRFLFFPQAGNPETYGGRFSSRRTLIRGREATTAEVKDFYSLFHLARQQKEEVSLPLRTFAEYIALSSGVLVLANKLADATGREVVNAQ